MKNLVSIAALLVALSLPGAAFAHTDTPDKTDKNGVPSYMDQALDKLPEKDAAKFRDTMKAAHEKNMALFDKVHELHDDIDDILTAKTFDEDAFRGKSAELREVYETMRSNTDDVFAVAVNDLPQKDRKILADAMAYPHKKHKAAKEAQ